MVSSIFSVRSLVYLLYAVVLTAVLLYVRFPTEKFRAYCEHRLEQVFANGRCTIVEIAYRFPAAVEFRKVTIGQQENDSSGGFMFDRVKLSPASQGFLKSWQVDGELYAGLLRATLTVQLKEKMFQLKDINIEKIDFAAITSSMPLLKREITGEFTFSGEYKANFDQPLAGLGNGNLRLSGGSIDLVQPILTMDTIDFQEVKSLWRYGDSVFSFTEGKMVGQQLDAEFNGTVKTPFLPPVGGLKISGSLVPGEQFLKDKPQVDRLVQRLMRQYKKSAVPFRLGGTLDKPTFRLSM